MHENKGAYMRFLRTYGFSAVFLFAAAVHASGPNDFLQPTAVMAPSVAGQSSVVDPTAGDIVYDVSTQSFRWYSLAGWVGFAAGLNSLQSIRLDTGNGYASSPNGMIRRFSTVTSSSGSSIRYSDSTAGTTFTILQRGLYSVSYSEQSNFSFNSAFGISLNSQNLGTSINSIPNAERMVVAVIPGSGLNFGGSVSITIMCEAGDVIRPHADGSAFFESAAQLVITRVSL